jgi:hypothetical protein
MYEMDQVDDIRTSTLRCCPDIRLLIAPNKISPGPDSPGAQYHARVKGMDLTPSA